MPFHKGSQNGKYHRSHHYPHQYRSKPVLWERPFFPYWDIDSAQHYSNFHNGSREDIAMYEHNRRHLNDYYRYDSDGILNGMGNDGNISSGSGCCNRYLVKPVPMKQCCPCEYNNNLPLPTIPSPSPASWAKRNQVVKIVYF